MIHSGNALEHDFDLVAHRWHGVPRKLTLIEIKNLAIHQFHLATPHSHLAIDPHKGCDFFDDAWKLCPLKTLAVPLGAPKRLPKTLAKGRDASRCQTLCASIKFSKTSIPGCKRMAKGNIRVGPMHVQMSEAGGQIIPPPWPEALPN